MAHLTPKEIAEILTPAANVDEGHKRPL
jgi:hypothetical protein